MKVLVTGSHGMLATDLVRTWSAMGHEVVGFSHSQLDITRGTQVREAVEGVRPDVIVCTPGTGVDVCEAEPEQGYLLHTWAAGMLARQSQRSGAAFVYISTCGLFGDGVKFYSEYDPVQLKTKYAESKFFGEKEALRACQRTYIIRPGWLYGGDPDHARNFVYQRFLEAKQAKVLRSAGDKFGSPTYTGDLANKTLEIVASGEYGVYHVTNTGGASRYEYVKCIVDAFGLSTAVEQVDSSNFQRAAPVPDCEQLENLNLKFLGLQPMSDWQETIHRYVSQLERDQRVS